MEYPLEHTFRVGNKYVHHRNNNTYEIIARTTGCTDMYEYFATWSVEPSVSLVSVATFLSRTKEEHGSELCFVYEATASSKEDSNLVRQEVILTPVNDIGSPIKEDCFLYRNTLDRRYFTWAKTIGAFTSKLEDGSYKYKPYEWLNTSDTKAF